MINRLPRFIAAGLLVLMLAGCESIRRGVNGGGDDPLASGDGNDKPAAELHGITSIRDLPPVIAEARGHGSVDDLVGPRKPHVAWNVALPFSSPPSLIQGIAGDNTVYVSGYDGVGAVRDGKVQWADRVSAPSEVGLSNDGALWFTKSGTGQWFTLNRNGEGGLLPGSFRPPPELARSLGPGCSGNGRWVRALGRSIPLEYECTRPQAKIGPDGLIYVGTDAPDIRAYSPTGTLLWKLKTDCAAETMLIGPNSRVFFSCKDNSLHLIEKGAFRWSVAGDGEIQEANLIRDSSSMDGVMDREGTVYFVDRPVAGIATHIHALSASGKMAWTIETGAFMVSTMQFDARGNLYLCGQRGMGQRLVSISD